MLTCVASDGAPGEKPVGELPYLNFNYQPRFV